MQFGILGPLEVSRDGQVLDLGARKQRSLLALLLIHANRVLSTDRILDELWGDDAAGKENALWVYVSRLRTILEPAGTQRGDHRVLVTQDQGYVLRAEPSSIDAQRFAAAATEGRALVTKDPAAASAVLDEALAIWRGEALQDFAYDDFAGTEIIRLEEMRLNALEDRFDADLRRGLSGELIGDLESMHQQHPLRERPIHYLMLALYRSGRSADALRAFRRFGEGLGEDLGIEPSPELKTLEEQILLHDSRLQVPVATQMLVPAREEITNPFKGLRTFTEEDADNFFGRERLVSDVLGRLEAGDRLTVLVGASGSGKSSAVRAGIIPALRRGALEGSDRWPIAYMVPGSHPFAEMEAALIRSTADSHRGLDRLPTDDRDGLLRAVLRLAPDDATPIVLVIDQFEELFTLVPDHSVRQQFLDNVVTALDDPHGRLCVVLALRADLYDRPLEYREFGSRFGSAVVNVLPLSPEELEAAMREPAKRSGVAIEPALVAELITDVLGEPGALPLFQYTLTELFEQRSGETLTAQAYHAMGGVKGALTRRAEELFAQMSAEQQTATRQLFLRLVAMGGQLDVTRRRVPAAEIVALDVDVVEIQSVIEHFGSRRLLSFDRDQISGAPTVEVAHEALLREWERLRSWIDDGRGDLRRQSALAAGAREWEDADRDPDYLFTGSRLAEFVAWRESSTLSLTKPERQFLDAAMARTRDEEESAAARAAEERRLRRSARIRPVIAAAVVALIVAAGFVVSALLPGSPEIVIVGPLDGDTVQAMQRGLDRASEEFGVEGQMISGVSGQLEADVRGLAESGADLVIFDGEVPGWIGGVIVDHPNVTVAAIGDAGPPPGVGSTVFAHGEAAYVAGAVAALATQSGRIGFMGPRQDRAREAIRAGFEAGARSVDPDIEIWSAYVGSGPTDNDAFATAAGLYAARVDVVYTVGEPDAVATAAWDLPPTSSDDQRWVIAGSGTDGWLRVANHLKPHVLTSTVQQVDDAVFAIVEDFVEGDTAADVRVVGLRDGAFELSRSGGWLDRFAADAAELGSDVASGEIDVPLYPDSLVQKPRPFLGRPEVSIFVTWRDDGSCRFGASDPRQGEAEFKSGDLVGISFVNRSSAGAGVMLSSGDTYPTLEALAKPNSDSLLWATLGPGTYTISCTGDATGSDNGVLAHEFTVPHPSACPPRSGTDLTGDDTLIHDLYDAIEHGTLDAVLAGFTEDAHIAGEGDFEPVEDFVRDLIVGNPPDSLRMYNLTQDASTFQWDQDQTDGGVLYRSCGHTAAIVGGKISSWTLGTSP